MNINTKILLNNGTEIPQLGFGTFKAAVGEETVDAVINAIRAGYRHIDTASVYGNEESVGLGIRKSEIKREDLFITSKLWNTDMRAGRQYQAFEESLQKLGLDYLDLYLIHWPVENFTQSWKALEKIYKSGKVRSIGVSNFHSHHLDELLQTADIVPAINQFECHPYLAQNELITYCRRFGIAPQAYSPLGGRKGNLMENETIGQISKDTGHTMAQVMLRWNLQRGLIVIPKSVHESRITENCRLYDFELTQSQMDKINALNCDRRFGSNPDNFDF